MLGWHRLRNYTAGSSAVHSPTASTHTGTRTVTASRHNPTHTHTLKARGLARRHSNHTAANTRHISARYASGLHLFRKNRLVPVCFAFIMAVCTGTASYLAVNRQANAASAPSSPTNVSLSAGTPVLPYHGIAQYPSAAARLQTISSNTAPLVPAAGRLTMPRQPLPHIPSPASPTTTSTKCALPLKPPRAQALIRQSSSPSRTPLQPSLRSTQQQTSRQDKLSPYREAGFCRKGRRLCR